MKVFKLSWGISTSVSIYQYLQLRNKTLVPTGKIQKYFHLLPRPTLHHPCQKTARGYIRVVMSRSVSLGGI